MRIVEITIRNFKIFRGEVFFKINNGLVLFVGENNTGKTSVFEAINFLRSGLPEKVKVEDLKNKQAGKDAHVSVEIKIQGRVSQITDSFSDPKYKNFIYDEDGLETIRIQRSSEKKTIIQGKKPVELNEKKVTLWNKETKNFENVFGLDSIIGTLFESLFVWSDTHPDEIVDFGSTKICGKLLSSIVGDFYASGKWNSFVEAHRLAFCDGEESLSKRAEKFEKDIQNILQNQYGDTQVKFNFSLPDPKTFINSTSVTVNDGNETDLKEKGSGMQRAFALAVIQVYANFLIEHNADAQKSIFFFIDEPEISLHPKAQKTLMDALKIISKSQQIFLTTHSPYILRDFSPSSHDIFVFNKTGQDTIFKPSSDFKLFCFSPTWGEINYFAYDLPTIEFHDELYGFLHSKYMSEAPDSKDLENRSNQTSFEKNFLQKKMSKNKKWIPVIKGVPQNEQDVTLSTFIRNKVHHPENEKMLSTAFSDDDLRESISELIKIVKNS